MSTLGWPFVSTGWAVRSFGGLSSTYWWLWTSHFVYWAGRFTMIFLSLFLTAGMGLSASSMGVHIALFGAGGVISVLWGGAIADLLGRRPALLGSMLCSAALTASLSITGPGPALAAVLFCLGLASFATKPVFETFMSDVVDTADRHRAYSLNFIAINSGFIVAPLIAAMLIERSYTTMLLAEAGVLLVVSAMVMACVPSDRRRRPARGLVASGPGLSSVFKDRVFMAFTAVNLAYMVVLMQNTLSLPIFMKGAGYSTQEFALLLSLNGGLLILFQIPVSNRVRKHQASSTLVLATGLMAVGYGIYPFADTWWLLAIAVVVWTCGELINMPTAAWMASRFGPPELRGRYLGVFATTSALAFLIGPMTGGFLLDLAGAKALWWVCSGLMVAASIARWLLVSAQEDRIRDHP